MRLACCVVLCTGLTVGAQDKIDPSTDLKQLEGTWQVISMEVFGKPAPPDKAVVSPFGCRSPRG